MRIQSIIAAALALVLLCVSLDSSSAQPLGPQRYGSPTEATAPPANSPEELPPTAADNASPSAPLQPLDAAGRAGESWDVDSFRNDPLAGSEPTTSQPPVESSPPPTTRTPPMATQPGQNAFTRPPAESAPAASAMQPRTSTKDLLADMLSPTEGSELDGEPISLGDAMDGIYGRDRQTKVVSAYWELTAAVAKYYVSLRARQASTSTTPWRESHLEAVRAQHRLAQVLEWEHGRLPLPSTQPHSGSYKTRYDEIFAGRANRRAWELDQTLPLLYEVMKAHAGTLSNHRTDAALASQAHRFLDVVREYNLAIAEYALLATGDTLAGRELVPLLIRVDREEDDEHVAGQRDRLGRTSNIHRDRAAPAGGSPGRALVDPLVVRTAGQQPGGTLRERSVLRAAERDSPATLSGQSPSQPASSANQWRERNPRMTLDP